MYKHEEELIDKVARILGWIDYPEDSVERGIYWHRDASKAPFGPKMPIICPDGTDRFISQRTGVLP